MNFLALSHTPPALAIIRAIKTPVTSAPAKRPPKPDTPSKYPVRTGADTANRPGRIISRIAALVEISTHRAESGSAFPSISPSISRNCLRTSSIILAAERPTAFIVNAAKMNGNIPPISIPMSTFGLSSPRSNNRLSKTCSPPAATIASAAFVLKVLNRANAVSAADPMANPLPIAAVVLPTASSASVRSLTYGSHLLISAIPPALSATGP